MQMGPRPRLLQSGAAGQMRISRTNSVPRTIPRTIPKTLPKAKPLGFLMDSPDPGLLTRYLLFIEASSREAASAPSERQADIFWNCLRARDAVDGYIGGSVSEAEFSYLLSDLERSVAGTSIWPWAAAAVGIAVLLYLLFRTSR